jgi:hypothetical protein
LNFKIGEDYIKILKKIKRKENFMEKDTCVHDWNGNGVCPLCYESDSFIIKDIFRYNELYLYISQNEDKNEKSKFELSKELQERCDRWIKIYNKPKKEYFDKLKKESGLRYTPKYLYRIFRVSEIFPNLCESSTLSFCVYEKIANSKISPEDKNKIRLIAEEKQLSVRKVKRLIEEHKEKPNIIDEKTINFEFVGYSPDVFDYESFKEFKKMKCSRGDLVTIIIKVKRMVNKKEEGGKK